MRVIREKKFFMILLFTIMAGVWLSRTFAEANSNVEKKITKKNADFTVETECGIDGLVVYDAPTIVRVTVKCKKNFIGTIRMLPAMEYGARQIAYGEDIVLSAGEKKTFTFTPSALTGNEAIRIEILDEKDKVIYAEKNQITMQGMGERAVVGILSDDYSALSYLDGQTVSLNNIQQTSSILELTKDSFPERAEGLKILEYIVIDNFDTASLSEEQYAALKTWVEEGGVLILSLGSNYQNVLHCFNDEFLSGTIGSLQKKQVIPDSLLNFGSQVNNNQEMDALEENTMVEGTTDSQEQSDVQQDESELDEPIAGIDVLEPDCIEFKLDGGKELENFTVNESAFYKKVGLGNIVVLAYSLGMEPLTGYEYKGNFAGLLLELSATEGTINKINGVDSVRNSFYECMNLAKLADDGRKPSVILYGVLLVVYVILIGPGLYLILKAVNKREKIWASIPVVVLVFTGIIYMTGRMYRINKPLISTFTMMNLSDGRKTEKIYTKVICPKPKNYSIQFKEEYSGFDYNPYEYSYSVFGNSDSESDIDYMIKKNSTGNEVSLYNKEPFQETGFVVNKTDDNNIGTIDSNLTCLTTGFEGTVTNNTCYDLTNVVVSFENYYYMAGDIKKGEQITIDSDKVFMAGSYGTFSYIYEKNKNLYTDRQIYMQYQIDTLMDNFFVDKNAYNKGYIWAAITDYIPDLIEGGKVKQAGCGVLITTYEAEYSDVSGAYYPSIDAMAIASQGEYDEMDRSIYSQEVVITYSFKDCGEITRLVNMTGKDSNSYGGKPAEVLAYNNITGVYEPLFKDGDTVNSKDLEKYMLEDVIILKYMQASNGFSTYIPRICARGDK